MLVDNRVEVAESETPDWYNARDLRELSERFVSLSPKNSAVWHMRAVVLTKPEFLSPGSAGVLVADVVEGATAYERAAAIDPLPDNRQKFEKLAATLRDFVARNRPMARDNHS